MARKYYVTPTQYAGRYTISQLYSWRVLFLDSNLARLAVNPVKTSLLLQKCVVTDSVTIVNENEN